MKPGWKFLQMLEIDGAHDPAIIPLLDRCTKVSISYHRDTFSFMFLVAVFTIPRTQKQPG